MARFLHGSNLRESDAGFFRMFPIPGTRFKSSTLQHLSSYLCNFPIKGDLHGANGYSDPPRDRNPTLSREASPLPAGYTYFGQFLDHDVTLMQHFRTAPGSRPIDADSLVQERSSSLDLDSLYGEGLNDPIVRFTAEGKFYSECTDAHGLLIDFPRQLARDGRLAFIADARNDENFILAQLQLLFMNLHNLLMDVFSKHVGNVPDRFGLARHALILLYQQVTVRDFLDKILQPDIHRRLFPLDLRTGKAMLDSSRAEEAGIPIEFSGAAFRFGHSLVLPRYNLNPKHKGIPLNNLFRLTGPGGLNPSPGGKPDREAIERHRIEWDHFFFFGNPRTQYARRIEPRLTNELLALVNEQEGNNDLFLRNLLRGKELGLPCAQDIIAYLQNNTSSYPDVQAVELLRHPLFEDWRILQAYGFDRELHALTEKTPLWLYILLEPYFHRKSDAFGRLGSLGSIIVGETFRLLVKCSNFSLFQPYVRDRDSELLGLLFDRINEDSRRERDACGIPCFRITDLVNFLETRKTKL